MLPTSCFDFPLLRDDVTTIVQDAVLTSLEGKAYDQAKVNDWINVITMSCLEDLKKLCQNFKYIVTCCIKQKRGGGMDMESVCYWDEKSDGACFITWENSSMQVIITIYGLAI
ncbi:hypothetical protein LEN26_018102 [Aphanomyces euteiches]|nr:hypothetical protein Ae201684P_011040 [Aphanomyces euteiches]KAH9094698.1 hypothetical protein LEN26_018102 [Aphanomyces euteiches]KAH9111797.1 hypothetical protein AeMF1_013757 [Aphanomyces euteiches]KAH9146211.1 hypothetical protein AeRB84_009883 [Aphanomyces euteiches]KAH9188683.1 hypothetical protein AeNC1_009337 [Aphanomyces euteiches]